MITFKSTIKIFTLLTIVFAFSAIANAQATRTWVSGVGDDVNPCSRTAPCKTFAGAISKTAVNGEINCLDPAGYGAVTVTKSITIDCEDTQGSILSSGTNGVIVNITAATDIKKAFKIRGISINGAGTGINGIRVLAANTVHLDEVVIDGVTQHGVSLETTSGSPKVFIQDTHIRSVTGNAVNSFIIGGSMRLSIAGSQLGAAGIGLNLSGNTNATVSDSQIIGNTTGLQAFNSSLAISNCSIANNTTGVVAGTGGTVRIFGSFVTHNTTGLSLGGGSIISHVSNVFAGNTTDGAPSSSLVLQ
ncbi:MAG: hypothetical protein DMF63_12465 [Acidobacteria bacterium]|nr:MAG: hypothetical protein DMF63_12465 [Acidobacteriota bacterium]